MTDIAHWLGSARLNQSVSITPTTVFDTQWPEDIQLVLAHTKYNDMEAKYYLKRMARSRQHFW